MHILLSNDDGIRALGIIELAQSLPADWRISIIAPEHQQSGMSHALSLRKELVLKHVKSNKENIKMYSLSGTPTDCVKFALDYYLKDDMPDLLISGVNDGLNLGSDAIYSGTVGAGMEGLFYNIPCLAISTEEYSTERGKEIFPFINEMIDEIFIKNEFDGFVNINFPKAGECNWANLRVGTQDIQYYGNAIEEVEITDEYEVYRVVGDFSWNTDKEDSDISYVEQGLISITALQWQQLDEIRQEKLENIVLQKQQKPQV